MTRLSFLRNISGLFLLLPLLLSCSATESAGGSDADGESADAPAAELSGLAAAQVESETVAGTLYYSSAKLDVTWTPPEGSVDHYVVTYTDAVQSVEKTLEVPGSESGVTLTALKSGTEYSVSVQACENDDCSDLVAESPAAVTASTAVETWQLHGSGNRLPTVTHIVQNGNTKAFAFRYGDDAGTELAGKVRLFYDPQTIDDSLSGAAAAKGIRIATNSEAASDADSVSSFTDVGTSYGLFQPEAAAGDIEEIATSGPVPMTDGDRTWIRLFFEAEGEDNVARIFYLDSQDGAAGLDYNSGADTNCETAADYGAGGGCEPTLVIGVDGDAEGANENVSSARQFKVGYPTLDDWKWDGSAGTFMVFTLESSQNCAPANKELGYAVWDGTDWNVEYDENGCPEKFRYLQAPVPFHMGEASYKLYAGYPNDFTITGVSVPVVGPKRIIYGEGSVSGEADVVDYDDWESVDDAREIDFLWPDGSALSAEQEDLFDDFVFYAPTGDLDLQVFYGAMNDGTESPFIGMAVLVNP